MIDQVRIGDDGQLEIERTWDGEPLWSVETQQKSLFAGDAFQQMPGQLPIEDDPWRPCASEALCDALTELEAESEIQGWRKASDFETRSLWRVAVRLPGCEQLLTEAGGWELVRNCRELRS